MYSHHSVKTSPTSTKLLYSPSVIRLSTNAYTIYQKVEHGSLHKYSINFENEGGSNEEESDLEEGEIQEPQQLPILEQDKPLLFKEFLKQKSSQIFRTNSGQLIPHAFKIDDMIIYTRDKLYMDEVGINSKTCMGNIKIGWISEDGIKRYAYLNYVEAIAMNANTANINYFNSINTIIRHKASCDLLNFGQTFFWPAGSSNFKDRTGMSIMLDCAFGIYLSGVTLTKIGLAVILDHTAAALTKTANLINLMESFRVKDDSEQHSIYKRTRTLQPLQFLDANDQLVGNFCSSIVGLKCYIKHMRHKQTFRIKQFTQLSANSSKFRWDEENCDITISEYFFRKHSIRLRYPNLPCLIKSSNDERQAMYPFELCYLLKDQKIRKSRLNPNIAKRLDQTKESPITSISPSKRSEYSQEVNKIFINLSRKHIGSFGLELSTRPLTANGRVIDPPTLQYRDDKFIIPADGRWKTQKFLESPKIYEWFVVNTSRTTRMNQIQSFVEGFRNYSFVYFGLTMDAPNYKDISVNYVDDQAIQAVVSECIKECESPSGPQLILFVVNDKNELYSCIHYVSDILFGIKATCIHDKNIRPISELGEVRLRYSTPVMANLSQKINAKLGGINMKSVSTTESTIYSNDLINAMFVGCDVTHPDSNTSDASSIAACVASCSSDFFQYITSIRIQVRKNDEIVHSIDEMMKELLCVYKIKNNDLPSKIFFYRDGVSENQFEQVKQLEITKLDELFTDTYQSKGFQVPSLTFIVVQKRHRMRFFEESHYRQSQMTFKNPRPGTVVDNTVTNPKDEDFYLYSHWNTKGTSRPSHYHVIRNDSGYNMDKLQKITYFMCHTYARCSQSISLPAVVRYAHLAAYRARVLLIAAKKSIKTKASCSSGYIMIEPKENLDDMIKLNSLLKDTMYFC